VARIDFDPQQTEPRAFYKLLTATVVPRPIAWVSTRSAGGVDNLAPHSFFTVACADPPVLQFTSVGDKDSLRNVLETGEFVVNFSPASLFEEINATGTAFAPEVSEFEAVGIESEPSARVTPLRVARSPAAFECRLADTLSFGDSTVVFGRVVHAAVDESVMDGDLPDVERLAPIARLGKIEWGELGTVRRITRIPADEWPGHYGKAAADGRGEEDESTDYP
jgi:flavin reductase (DIM6/NTAB) family NADH-FMN oxidoreductase RutF